MRLLLVLFLILSVIATVESRRGQVPGRPGKGMPRDRPCQMDDHCNYPAERCENGSCVRVYGKRSAESFK